MIFKRLVLIGLAVLMAGCAVTATRQADLDLSEVELEAQKQRELAFERTHSYWRRLHDVWYRLAMAGADFCGRRTEYSVGIRLVNKYWWSEPWRTTAVALWNVGDNFVFNEVFSGGAADRSGVRMWDQLVSVNNVEVPNGKRGLKKLGRILHKSVKKGDQVDFKVVRGGHFIDLNITPDRVCRYDVFMPERDEVNAFATGTSVVINRGMLRFAKTEQELALIVSHELAHNIMGHVGGRWYPQEKESEADYVGLYLMARAGFPIKGSADFWRRIGTEYGGSIQSNHTSTHPASPARFVAINNAIDEIRKKQDDKKPLVPNVNESVWKKIGGILSGLKLNSSN